MAVGEQTEDVPQLEEHEVQKGPAAVGEQLEAEPDNEPLLNEPVRLVQDFARVETTYLQWLQNMHRAVHLFQSFRRLVDSYHWDQGAIEKKGRRFVHLLRQTIRVYTAVRNSPMDDAVWDRFKVKLTQCLKVKLNQCLQVKLIQCTYMLEV